MAGVFRTEEKRTKGSAEVNHTTRLGASAFDFAGTGLSFYGSYNINRGDAIAECDATAIDARLGTALDRVREVLGL